LDLLRKDRGLETANEDGVPVLDVEPQVRLLYVYGKQVFEV